MTVRAALTAIAIACAAPASAQQASDLYLGVALDYGIPDSGSDEAFGAVMGGFSFDVGTIGVGLEAEFGTQFGGSDSRDITRVRAVISYDFSNVTGFVTAGAAQYDVNDQNSDGETFGFGLQAPISENIDGRIEVIRDLIDDDFDTDVTTARVALLYQF